MLSQCPRCLQLDTNTLLRDFPLHPVTSMPAPLDLDTALTGLVPKQLRRALHMWRPARDMADQYGKVFVVTGGNSGVGFQVVKWLAAKNATVIMATHNMPGARK